MSPPKKRARIGKTTNRSEPTLDEIEKTLAPLLSEETSSNSTKDDLLRLASLQHQLYQTISQQEAQIQLVREKNKKERQNQQAASYERQHLQSQMTECQNVAFPHLEQLAREETGDEGEISKILQTFLQVDVKDVKQKDTIVAKLRECFRQRKFLEKDVRLKRQQLDKLQEKLKQKQGFLASLDFHVKTLERASQSIAKLMGNQQPFQLSGNERLSKLENARKLPTPLYTLFGLLQHVADEQQDCKVLVKTSHDEPSVVLQVPLPHIQAASPPERPVSINFYYTDSPTPVVTTKVTGCPTRLDQDLVLHSLYPDDDDVEPQQDQILLSKPTPGGRETFPWCNHLAGLYHVYQPTVQSARVVLMQIRKRIRSGAILQHIFNCLQRGSLPPLPNTTEEEKEELTRLDTLHATIEYIKDDQNGCKVYTVKIGDHLKATVHVDVRQYPTVPPVWSCDDEKLQHELNVTAIRKIVKDNDDSSEMIRVADVDEYCEWILVHQIHIVVNWDDAVSPSSGRKQRGRDRRAP